MRYAETSHFELNFSNAVQKEVKNLNMKKTIEATILEQCDHAY